MHTQTTSKARIKNDTVGEEGMKFLFEQYGTQPIEQFRTLCKDAIEKSTGKKETKETFFREIDKARSKDQMLQKVTNYLLAGQGLGV